MLRSSTCTDRRSLRTDFINLVCALQVIRRERDGFGYGVEMQMLIMLYVHQCQLHVDRDCYQLMSSYVMLAASSFAATCYRLIFLLVHGKVDSILY